MKQSLGAAAKSRPDADDKLTDARIERATHAPSNAAYDRAERMDERREMLPAHADYLEKLKAAR